MEGGGEGRGGEGWVGCQKEKQVLAAVWWGFWVELNHTYSSKAGDGSMVQRSGRWWSPYSGYTTATLQLRQLLESTQNNVRGDEEKRERGREIPP